MNKKFSRVILIILSLIFIIFMIISNNEVKESVTFSISIWKDNLFPTLFPFFVVSNILINYGFIEIIGNILSYPMKKLFKLPKECGFVLGISLFSGFPSGAKYTSKLVSEKIITTTEANRLLTFTNYSNPLFILGFIGSILNKKYSYIILISHILGGLITGIIFNYNKNKKITNNNKSKKINNYDPLGKALHDSIIDSLNTMFLLLGIVTIFLIISSLITNLFNLNSTINILISGLLEATQGIKKITFLNISDLLKIIYITGFISFSGLSVHMQVLSIISEYKIKYKSFFIARILHTIISCGLVSILYFIIS